MLAVDTLPLPGYYVEKLIYGSFILLWLAIKVDRQLLPWAMCSLGIFLLALILIALNELILQKVRRTIKILSKSY